MSSNLTDDIIKVFQHLLITRKYFCVYAQVCEVHTGANQVCGWSKNSREEEEAEEAGAEGTETDGDGWEEAGSVWIDLKVK